MPRPNLTGVHIPRLPRHGNGLTESGTITGSGIGIADLIVILTRNQKKQWEGLVSSETSTAGTWNFSVTCTKYEPGPPTAPETVTVTVSNTDGPSAPIPTTTDVP